MHYLIHRLPGEIYLVPILLSDLDSISSVYVFRVRPGGTRMTPMTRINTV